MNVNSLLVLIAAFLFLFLLIFPKGREIYLNKLILEQKKLKLRNAETAISQLNLLTKEFVQIKRLLEKEKSLFLNPINVGDSILFLLDSSLNEGKANLISVTPQNDQMSSPFSFGKNCYFRLLPVEFQLKGGYEDISRFIHRLLTQDKLILPEKVVISNANNDADMLDCKLTVKFFINYSDAETETR